MYCNYELKMIPSTCYTIYFDIIICKENKIIILEKKKKKITIYAHYVDTLVIRDFYTPCMCVSVISLFGSTMHVN